jgi:hypothetical protein
MVPESDPAAKAISVAAGDVAERPMAIMVRLPSQFTLPRRWREALALPDGRSDWDGLDILVQHHRVAFYDRHRPQFPTHGSSARTCSTSPARAAASSLAARLVSIVSISLAGGLREGF